MSVVEESRACTLHDAHRLAEDIPRCLEAVDVELVESDGDPSCALETIQRARGEVVDVLSWFATAETTARRQIARREVA